MTEQTALNDNNQPSIRFSGFDGDWVEKKIENVLTEKHRPITLDDDLTYELVTVKRRNGGIVSRGKLQGKQILVKNYSQVQENDFLISKRQIIHGSCGLVPKELNNAIVSNEYLVIVGNDEITTECWTLLSKRPQMYKMFFISSFGVDIEKMVFSVPDWKNKFITIPKVSEQTAIGNFFQQIDDSLNLYKRKQQQTQQFKQAMLNKMFPQQGQSQPAIRLTGFSGDWVESEFSDIASLSRGLTYNPNSLSKKGVRVLRSSNIYQDVFKMHKNDIFVTKDAINIKYVDNGDILITSANGSSKLVGKHAIINNLTEDTVHGGFMLIARTTVPYFLNASMSSNWYNKFVKLFTAGGGGSIGNLSKGDLEKHVILIPLETKEQTAIGHFFKQLDDTLALYSQQIATLEILNKALLAKMFV